MIEVMQALQMETHADAATDGTTPSSRSRRRRRLARGDFTGEHDQKATHLLVQLSSRVVLVVLGPTIPHPEKRGEAKSRGAVSCSFSSNQRKLPSISNRLRNHGHRPSATRRSLTSSSKLWRTLLCFMNARMQSMQTF
jgi:hypothetical protein